MGFFDKLKGKNPEESRAETGILNEISRIISKNMEEYLPHVKSEELENDGAVFYMNGKNGTEFDWYVNDRLPYFMVFYNDKDNLGAVKLGLYKDGEVQLYIYDEKGKNLVKKVSEFTKIKEADLEKLAVMLANEADYRRFWDGDIKEVDTEAEVSEEALEEFRSHEENYTQMKNRLDLLVKRAIVSKEITEDEWKVGYMERTEPHDESDSGWFFSSGREDDTYVNNPKNLSLITVGAVWELDGDIFKYIDMPVGTRLIRISAKDFEIDKNDREIYTVRRNK